VSPEEVKKATVELGQRLQRAGRWIEEATKSVTPMYSIHHDTAWVFEMVLPQCREVWENITQAIDAMPDDIDP